MAEPRDDDVSAAFRSLPPLEPPPALDEAIRAAARRAVTAKPVSTTRRWAIPASIAAVLALSIGIALHVEREQPLVVDGTPVPMGSAEYPVTQAPAEAPARMEATRTEPVANAATAAPAAPAAPARSAAPAEPAPAARSAANEAALTFVPTPAPGAASVPAPAPAPAPVPAPVPAPEIAAPPAAAAPPPRPSAKASATADAARAPSAEVTPGVPAAAPMRAKREATGASVAKEATAPTPEKALERIAELRAAGRHDEADEALAKFRRDYPDFRIAPALWEKVRAR